MQGVEAIQARIAAIETRFGVARPASTTTIAPDGFDRVLEGYLGAPQPTGALPVTASGIAEGLATPALAGYENGRMPAASLAGIGVGAHRLWPPAGDAFDRLRTAASADGVRIGVTDSYRDFAAQEQVAAEKGLYSQGGLAAAPGTSPHGWGMALDLELDAAGQAWMRANGGRFGFVEDVPREPWHWSFRPEAVTA